MITITVTVGPISLKTFHIQLDLDLPVHDYKFHFSFLTVEITTGLEHATAPQHSTLVEATDVPNAHAAPSPEVTV